MKELLEMIAKVLVDHPEEVQVRAVQVQAVTHVGGSLGSWLGRGSSPGVWVVFSGPG